MSGIFCFLIKEECEMKTKWTRRLFFAAAALAALSLVVAPGQALAAKQTEVRGSEADARLDSF